MAARSIASLTLSFGLVSIPVKLYSATDSAAGVGFNLLTPEGGRVKQQYISEATGEVVARADMKKGYEFEKGAVCRLCSGRVEGARGRCKPRGRDRIVRSGKVGGPALL